MFLFPFRYVFFLDPCNIDFINRKINSISLCVSKCPADELKTHNDLKQFALNNGEEISTFSDVHYLLYNINMMFV